MELVGIWKKHRKLVSLSRIVWSATISALTGLEQRYRGATLEFGTGNGELITTRR